MTQVTRREKPVTHLNADTVPVERALRSRATQLQERAGGLSPGSDTTHVLLTLAAEFTELANELHYW